MNGQNMSLKKQCNCLEITARYFVILFHTLFVTYKKTFLNCVVITTSLFQFFLPVALSGRPVSSGTGSSQLMECILYVFSYGFIIRVA